jgi:lipid A 4'-phosphatase
MDGTDITQARAPFAVAWATPGALDRAVRDETERLRQALAARIRWSEPTTLALIAVLTLSAYFILFPSVDVAVSDVFYRAGDGFFLSQEPVLKTLRKSSTYVMGVILLAAVAGVAMRAFRTSDRRTVCARRCGFLLMGLAFGPGLVVNTWLKGSWGRARPIQTDLFGGDAAFTPAWKLSEGCSHNCSFVSGEASSAAWMVAALVLLPPAWRAKGGPAGRDLCGGPVDEPAGVRRPLSVGHPAVLGPDRTGAGGAAPDDGGLSDGRASGPHDGPRPRLIDRPD